MNTQKIPSNKARFIYYNIRERKAFQELCEYTGDIIHDMSNIDGYEVWDVIYSTKKNRCLGEIKVRNHFSTEVLGGIPVWVLEKKKYDELMNSHVGRLVSHIRLKTTYINVFFDKTLIWDLSNVVEEDFVWGRFKEKSSTGEDIYVDKQVAYLKVEDAAAEINYMLDYTKLAVASKEVFKFNYPNNKIDIINLF